MVAQPRLLAVRPLGAASGLLFLLLVMAGFAAGELADWPADDAPAAAVAAALQASAVAYKTMGFLLSLAGLALLVFASSLSAHLRAPAGDTNSLAAVAGAAAGFWAFLWLLAGLFVGGAPGLAGYYAHPEGATTLLRLASLPVNEQGLLLPALSVGATVLAGRRAGAFPGWYRRGSAMLAPLLLLGSVLSVFGLAFPTLPMSLVLFLAWIAATSAVMYHQVQPAQDGAPPGNQVAVVK